MSGGRKCVGVAGGGGVWLGDRESPARGNFAGAGRSVADSSERRDCGLVFTQAWSSCQEPASEEKRAELSPLAQPGDGPQGSESPPTTPPQPGRGASAASRSRRPR